MTKHPSNIHVHKDQKIAEFKLVDHDTRSIIIRINRTAELSEDLSRVVQVKVNDVSIAIEDYYDKGTLEELTVPRDLLDLLIDGLEKARDAADITEERR